MKKKHWQVSVFDKTSEIIKDDTIYTTDTEVYLVFELIDKNFRPDSATVTIYNIYGTATINESVDIVNGIVNYEMPVDAIGHSGGWRTQVVFTKDNEDYTTTVIDFDVDGHLLDNNKPTIVYIENWNSFIKHGERLVDKWEQLEKIRQVNERKRESAESVRQKTFETNEAERESTFEINESARQANESARESAESVRVANEEERELNEEERISKDSERDGKIENLQSEVVSARGGEVVLGDRLDRIESTVGEGSTEITIEDFIGFQDAIGGRNLLVERTKTPTRNGSRWESDYIEAEPNGVYRFSFSGVRQWDQVFEYNTDKEEVAYVQKTSSHTGFVHVVSDDTHFVRYTSGTSNVHRNSKIETGEKATPYTLAPEDYEEVTLTDLANHVNIIFGGEFTKLRNAIIAMGGTIV